ncbi:hypothetical protein AVEN_179598-1 [Araneus ventricosus]|uniref:Uncharacterized protein n=1 Tax=Araneus ventricosus TaxID=182803 RepID=A0A4Y2BBZ3_ARAVE|nr:hypothetical protein AVEN_179598-1 [Araneus ventricosus]
MPVDNPPSDGHLQKCEWTINESNKLHILWYHPMGYLSVSHQWHMPSNGAFKRESLVVHASLNVLSWAFNRLSKFKILAKLLLQKNNFLSHSLKQLTNECSCEAFPEGWKLGPRVVRKVPIFD